MLPEITILLLLRRLYLHLIWRTKSVAGAYNLTPNWQWCFARSVKGDGTSKANGITFSHLFNIIFNFIPLFIIKYFYNVTI